MFCYIRGDTEQEYNCPLCSQPDSLEHFGFDCTHNEAHVCRQRLWASVSEQIQRSTEDESFRAFMATMFEYVKASPRGGQLTIELYTSADADQLITKPSEQGVTLKTSSASSSPHIMLLRSTYLSHGQHASL